MINKDLCVVMNKAMYGSPYMAVNGAVGEYVNWRVKRDVFRAVSGTVEQFTDRASKHGSPHPALKDFLIGVNEGGW